MKKKTHTTIIATLLLANIAMADVPIIRITEIHKSGGRNILWGLFEPRYKNIDKTVNNSFVTDPATGTTCIMLKTTLICSEPGWAKCQLSVAENRINYNGASISENIFIDNANELIDLVDKQLEKGIYNGKTSKKVLVKASGKQFLFLFEATWKNGNENGDADIEIKVSDITAYSATIAGSATNMTISTH